MMILLTTLPLQCAGFNMLFATNEKNQTTYDIIVDRVESEDEDANEVVVDYLKSYVATLAVPSASNDYDPSAKLNPELTDQQRVVAE